ncbi:MAG: hypothetical protein WDM90_22990 [Ferruginibacter sp.]
MDIVCVGDGIELAAKVAEKFTPTPEVNFFKNFGTAQIKADGLEIEFVGRPQRKLRFYQPQTCSRKRHY